MTTSHTQLRASKKQYAPGKSCRPTLVQRHSHPKPHHRPNTSRGKTEITVEEELVEDDAMSATFPQFCAVCDNQILIPSSVLYCSEKCRKQDSCDSPSYAIFKSDANPRTHSPATTPLTPFESHDIVPKLSPTMSSRQVLDPTQLGSEASASDSENSSSSPRARRNRPSSVRKDSEAARYLAQFQHPDLAGSRPSSAKSSGMATPYLSLTPTSAASASMPFTPLSHTSSHMAMRPNNPRWSTSSFSTRSADLVTPITHCPTAPSSLSTITEKRAETSTDESSVATPKATEKLLYEKISPVSGSAMSPGQSSLKQLFRFDEMRA